jgi:ammonium transporter Rh
MSENNVDLILEEMNEECDIGIDIGIGIDIDKMDDDIDLCISRLLFSCSRGDLFHFNNVYNKYKPDINLSDYDGRTCLHVASSIGYVDIVKFLIDNGANVNVYDRFGGSPRDDAIRHGHDEITKILVDAGASKPAESFELELIQACSKGDLNSVKRLLNNKVNPNCCDYDGRTPLHLAIDTKNSDIVELLLKNKADPLKIDRFGGSPLSDAKRKKNRVGQDKILELLNGYVDVSKEKTSGKTNSFIIYFVLFECVILMLYALFSKYNKTVDIKKYPYYQDLHVMIFIGFGFIMTFLRKNGYSSVGFTFLIASLCIQLYPLLDGFWDSVFSNEFKMIYLDINTLIHCDFSAAAVLISYGVILGRVNPLQLGIMSVIEIMFYSLNENISKILNVRDTGGSMIVHVFGAFSGLACSRVLSSRYKNDMIDNVSIYHSDLFSMIGTLFLWIYWPSCTSIMTSDDVSFNMSVVNTLLSLTSSCVVAYISSYVMRKNYKFSIVDIQNATLAGGVAIGSVCDSEIQPVSAIVIGMVSGFMTVYGFTYIQSRLESILGVYDTCGVLNLHGIPGIIGGISSIIYNSYYTNERGGIQSYYQLLFLVITILIGLLSGVLSGMIMSLVKVERLFLDDEYWEVPEMETPYYFDVRGENEHKPVHIKQL